MTWWEDLVLYQVYPRSYADSNGDGIGDLPGLISKLDHLEWLGVDASWLSPTFPSPNHDWGYDVSDYYDVHPDFGTLADMERLIVEAGRRDLRVLLDLVPNHTSDAHAWFHDATKRDWYVWRDPKPDGSPPNNWTSVFGGAAWTLDPASGQYYLHNFLPEQPDLDWWNEDVRAAFDDIARFWFERGIAGFRIDVAHALIKDRELRDNPPAQPGDPPTWVRMGQRPEYNFGRPEAVDIHRRWRSVAREFDPERLLLGETYVLSLEDLMKYVVPDGLQLCMNLVFLHAPFAADALAEVVARTEELMPDGATPVWHASSHDDPRFATRWCDGDERAIRCALLGMLSLRGSCILYQGDEIGLEAVPVPAGTRARHDRPRRLPHADGLARRGRSGLHRAGSRAVASDRLTRSQRRRSARRPGLDSHADARSDRAAQAPPPSSRRLRARGRPPDVWAFRREGGALVALNLGTRGRDASTASKAPS